MDMTIKKLQEQSQEIAKHFPHTTIEQRLLFLMTEVGEVAGEVLNLIGTRGDVNKDDVRAKLGMEIYDVVWNLCDLANMLEIDLENAFNKKIIINQTRAWKGVVGQ